MRVLFQRAMSHPTDQAGRATSPKTIFGPHVDFWALGGASVLLWGLLFLADSFREFSHPVQQRMGQLAVAFSLLTVFVNYPHFMISYRFGYGRGAPFIRRNWFALVAVPLVMIAFFALAYVAFAYDVSGNRVLLALDSALGAVGLDLGVRDRNVLGKEILGASIWLMYFTVGWHYSKQVFGALMVYARLKGYALFPLERRVIKWNLFAVAFYQFFYMNRVLSAAGTGIDPRFPGISLTGFALPAWAYHGCSAFLLISSLAVVLIFANLFFRRGYKADPTFLVCWASFLLWWVPVRDLPEFYILAVPFFHSLQYLLFASKLEADGLSRNANPVPKMVAIVGVAILAGLAAFEIVPAALDTALLTGDHQSAWFFLSVAGVFFNVHHFFIDSVVWKLDQAEVKRALFG